MPSYGLWFLVAFNSMFFVLFAFSFFKPRTARDWRTLGAFSAFLVALFTEMYGFPLTIYVLSGWLQARYPGVDWFAHDSGHLPEMLLGWRAYPHLGPFHLASTFLIAGGFVVLARAWPVLYRAQRDGVLAETGPYGRVRHPQYVGFVLIMVGFLFQWPTILTVAMFPVLVLMYWRLALREEREAVAAFGEAYVTYAEQVPRFVPRRRGRGGRPSWPRGSETSASGTPYTSGGSLPLPAPGPAEGVNASSGAFHQPFTTPSVSFDGWEEELPGRVDATRE